MTEGEANAIYLQVTSEMKIHTSESITAVYTILNECEGGLWGTANWVTDGETIWLISAHHVFHHPKGLDLAVRTSGDLAPAPLHEDDGYHKEVNGEPLPVDVAVLAHQPRQSDRADTCEGSRMIKPVHIAKFAPEELVDTEIYFLHGYPGARGRFTAFLPGVVSDTFPYACLLTERHSKYDWYDSATHFLLDYANSGDIRNELGQPSSLPDPHGLSGSLVWKTGRWHSDDWGPEQAVIVGIVQCWDHGACALVCTRISHVLRFLIDEKTLN